ncbi:hypothetical protein KSP40_PGU003504 [Platanthera guangdongensis]|uniref:RMI1 N-terminal domain-containing protein n=1 Tax=Platanthera guangdongensis TaxID=2320717 RepID=A0ABR2LER5_9ASPA
MRRRNLRLPSSSDEDDAPPSPQDVNSPITNPRHCPQPRNAPLEISDDEFMDVDDSPSEHLSHPVSEQTARVTSVGVEAYDGDHFDGSVGAIGKFLRGAGLGLRLEWLSSCLSSLGVAIPGFEGLDLAGKAKMCFEQFLLEDMKYCGAGILPENVHCMDKVELEGPFVLQVRVLIPAAANAENLINSFKLSAV